MNEFSFGKAADTDGSNQQFIAGCSKTPAKYMTGKDVKTSGSKTSFMKIGLPLKYNSNPCLVNWLIQLATNCCDENCKIKSPSTQREFMYWYLL
ncbi:MAG: hypothetical protein EAZ35_10690 [Sphingobacteriia bacterium]|nr:MAG: hypothetical protein EAZ35_10690 [Sphingobacteriia bacterium]